MKNRFIYFTLFAAVYIFISGCGKTDSNMPVAIIDDKYVITVGEFLHRYERAQENFPQGQRPDIYEYDDGRLFLDKIITGRLLEIEAEGRGYDDRYLKKAVSDFESSLLADKLREDIANEVRINENRLFDFYNALGEQRYVQVIFSTDARAIETAYKELNAGVSFAEVAAVYNETPELRSSGGDVKRPVLYDGSFFTRQVFTIADEGDITDVIYSADDGGYLIIRLKSKEPIGDITLPKYSHIKGEIRTELTDILTEKKLREILDKRSAAARVEYNDEVYDAVFQLSQKELRGRYLRKGFVVCTADGEPVYFDEWFEGVGLQTGMSDIALDDLKRGHAGGYKELMDERLNVFIRFALALAEAKKRGLDSPGSYKREVSDFRSGLLIDRLNDEVFGRALPLPNDEERLRYFERHRYEFITSEKMSGFYFASIDKNLSGEIYDRVRAGEDIVSIASEVSGPGETLDEGYPVEAGFFDIYKDPALSASRSVPQSTLKPILESRIFGYGAGQISPLLNLNDGRYLFFTNFKYTPYSEPDLNTPGVIKEVNSLLCNGIFTGPAAEKKYGLWFDEMRKKHKIEVNEDGLENVIREINTKPKI